MGQLSVVKSEPLAVVASQPLGSERTRVDTNAIGIDHEQIQQHIADWASKLPPSLQQPAARMGTYYADVLASLAEMMSAPESLAAASAKPAMAAMDTAWRLMKSVPAATVRGAAAVADTVSPDVVGVISPRGGKALEIAQKIRDAARAKAAGNARATPEASPPMDVRGAASSMPSQWYGPPEENITGAPPAPPRSLNDAMAEAVAKARAGKATSRGGSAPGGTAPPADRPASAASPGPPAAPPRLRLTAPEVKLYQQLRAKGQTDAQALETIAAVRHLAGKLPTDAEVRATVQGRNQTGKWPGQEPQ